MIAPIARTPNTSGITFVTMVSEAAKPTPNSTSEASSASRDGHHSSASSATICDHVADPDRRARADAVGHERPR